MALLVNLVTWQCPPTEFNITERVGFEPTNSFLLNDFESFAFDHSATFPDLLTLTINLLNVN